MVANVCVNDVLFLRLKDIFGSVRSQQVRLLNEGDKFSRILAGNSFTQARKKYLEEKSSSLNLSLHDKVFGIGLCSTIGNEEEIFISIWNMKSIKTFKHTEKVNSESFSTEFIDFLSNIKKEGEENSSTSISKIYEINLETHIQEILNKNSKFLLITNDGNAVHKMPENDNKRVILSGSFNPLHKGHISMLQNAADWKYNSCDKYFELSVHNADKPSLDLNTILDRASQFAGYFNIILNSEPFFIEKAKLFSPATFVVGFDTAQRIINPKYYKSHDLMEKELQTFVSSKCNFLVCGRTVDNIWNLEIPDVST